MTQLIGKNWYGIQVQDANDQADLSNAARKDAWNMQQQGRGDAWAINRDNLNFGAWTHGQTMAQQAAAAEAQRRMHEATLNQGMTLFEKSNALADARDRTNWDRGARMRQIAEDQAGWAGEDRARGLKDRQAAEDLDNLLSGLLADPTMANADMGTFLQAAQGKIAAENAARGADKGQLKLPANYLMSAMERRQARLDAADAARRQRLASEATGDDPLAATEARKQIETDPTLKGTIDLGKAKAIPFQRGNIAHRPVEDAITAELTRGSIRRELNMLARDDGVGDEAKLQRLGAQVRRTAADIGAATGVDPRSIEADIMAQIEAMDDTSLDYSLQRGVLGLATLGLSELGDTRSERAAGVSKAMQYLGLAPISE
jgi:hypothetical protein